MRAADLVGPRVPPPQEMRARGGKKWTSHPADVLPMWLADMDFVVAEPIRAAAAEAASTGAFEYPSEDLYGAVGRAFVARMGHRFEWEPDIVGVELLADLVQGLVTSVVSVTGPGDAVVALTPVYPPFLMAAGVAGRRLVPVRLRSEAHHRVDVDELAVTIERTGASVLLLCNPLNPTGRVMSRDQLAAVADVARRHDVVVISDEIHADLVLDPVPHVPFASISDDARSRTITLQSASKAFNLGGLRCGVLHFGSVDLRRRFEARFPPRALGRVTGLSARATLVAWEECDPWLAEVVAQLRANRDIIARWRAELGDRVQCTPPQATYLAWLRLPGLADAGESAAEVLLGRARVALSAGEDFGGPDLRDHARLNFATSPELLALGLARIAAVVTASTPEGESA